MKLVDILARELKVWPEQAALAVQDGDGRKTIKFGSSGSNPSLALFGLENVWQSNGWKCSHHVDFDFDLLAEDWSTAVVTRAEWQAAVDALKAAENSAPAWVGIGLPPVGTVCEVLNGMPNSEWERCTILYSGKHRVMYDSESCSERVGFIEDLIFRPIRTPEQIAAEELKFYTAEICELLGWNQDYPGSTRDAKRLYDAGYRKFEIVEGE